MAEPVAGLDCCRDLVWFDLSASLFNEMLNVSDEESGCRKMDFVVIRTPSGPWEEASIAPHDIVTLEGVRSLPRAGCREGQGAELGLGKLASWLM